MDVAGWTRDSLALTLPANILCTPQCLGLCPECGENLNTAGPDHHHEKAPDARWAALSEIKFDSPRRSALLARRLTAAWSAAPSISSTRRPADGELASISSSPIWPQADR